MKTLEEEIRREFEKVYISFSQGSVVWWESDCVLKFILKREAQIKREAIEGFVEDFDDVLALTILETTDEGGSKILRGVSIALKVRKDTYLKQLESKQGEEG